MGQSQPPGASLTLTNDVFFIGMDSYGNWVAQDVRHRRCGLFATEEAARRFIRLETGHRFPPIIPVTGEFELDLNG
jgi:hypothetical protein